MTIKTSIHDEPWGQEKLRHPGQSRAGAITSMISGTALAVLGASRKNWKGAALAAGGGYLAYRGFTAKYHPLHAEVRVAFTINRPREEIYAFVRNPGNWEAVVPGLRARAGSGGKYELSFISSARAKQTRSQIHITDQRENEFIAWSSEPGSFEHRGVLHVQDADDERGTELSIALEYVTSAGPILAALAQSRGLHPEQLVREGLRRIKQLLEAGEIPTTEGQPVGARGMKGKALRFAMREPVSEQRVKLAGD